MTSIHEHKQVKRAREETYEEEETSNSLQVKLALERGLVVDITNPKKPKILWDALDNASSCTICETKLGNTRAEKLAHEHNCLAYKIEARARKVNQKMKHNRQVVQKCPDARATSTGQVRGEYIAPHVSAQDPDKHYILGCTSCQFQHQKHFYTLTGEPIETCLDCHTDFTYEELARWSYHNLALFLSVEGLYGYQKQDIDPVAHVCPQCRVSQGKYDEPECTY